MPGTSTIQLKIKRLLLGGIGLDFSGSGVDSGGGNLWVDARHATPENPAILDLSLVGSSAFPLPMFDPQTPILIEETGSPSTCPKGVDACVTHEFVNGNPNRLRVKIARDNWDEFGYALNLRITVDPRIKNKPRGVIQLSRLIMFSLIALLGFILVILVLR